MNKIESNNNYCRSKLFIWVSCGLYKNVLRCPAVFRQLGYMTLCY